MPSPLRKLRGMLAAKRASIAQKLAALRESKTPTQQRHGASGGATATETSTMNGEAEWDLAEPRRRTDSIQASTDTAAVGGTRTSRGNTSSTRATTRASGSTSPSSGRASSLAPPWRVTNTNFMVGHPAASDRRRLVASKRHPNRRSHSPPISIKSPIVGGVDMGMIDEDENDKDIEERTTAAILRLAAQDPLDDRRFTSPTAKGPEGMLRDAAEHNLLIGDRRETMLDTEAVNEVDETAHDASEEDRGGEGSTGRRGGNTATTSPLPSMAGGGATARRLACPTARDDREQPTANVPELPHAMFDGWHGAIAPRNFLRVLLCPHQQYIALKMLLHEAMQHAWTLDVAHSQWCPPPPPPAASRSQRKQQQQRQNDADEEGGAFCEGGDDAAPAVACQDDPSEVRYFQFVCEWKSLLVDIREFIDARVKSSAADANAVATTTTTLRSVLREVIGVLHTLELFQRHGEKQADVHAMQNKWSAYYAAYHAYAAALEAYNTAMQTYQHQCFWLAQQHQQQLQQQQQQQHQQPYYGLPQEGMVAQRHHDDNGGAMAIEGAVNHHVESPYAISLEAQTPRGAPPAEASVGVLLVPDSSQDYSSHVLTEGGSMSPVESSLGNLATPGGCWGDEPTPTNSSMALSCGGGASAVVGSSSARRPHGHSFASAAAPTVLVLPPPPALPAIAEAPQPPTYKDVPSFRRHVAEARHRDKARKKRERKMRYQFTGTSIIMRPPTSGGAQAGGSSHSLDSAVSNESTRRSHRASTPAAAAPNDGAPSVSCPSSTATLHFLPLNWGSALCGAARATVVMQRRKQRLWAQTVANAGLGFRNDDEDY